MVYSLPHTHTHTHICIGGGKLEERRACTSIHKHAYTFPQRVPTVRSPPLQATFPHITIRPFSCRPPYSLINSFGIYWG